MSSIEVFRVCLLVTLYGADYCKIDAGFVSGFALEIKCLLVKVVELNMSVFNEGDKCVGKTLKNNLILRRK